jgi:predicted acetyltransferase
MLVLRKLTESDVEAFQRAYRATVVTDPTFARGFAADMPFPVYLARLDDDEQGLHLPENYVPSTMYWGFIGSELVGRLMLRHRLNERLRQTGGNIGYVVVPEYRRRGIAVGMLRLALPLARERGLDQALITCDEDNAASRRVVEKCGGLLEGTSPILESGVIQCRYWISLR